MERALGGRLGPAHRPAGAGVPGRPREDGCKNEGGSRPVGQLLAAASTNTLPSMCLIGFLKFPIVDNAKE